MTNSCKDSTVCHVYRTGGDIKPLWDNVTGNFDANYPYLQSAKPGFWPDADMMQVGCRNFTTTINLTYDESRAHFSMWCFMMSPLIIGFDLSRTHPINKAPTIEEYRQTVSIFANAELVALNQDTIGFAGRRIKGQGSLEVWIKNCADGAKAVMLLNRTSSAANMTISQTELGWSTASQIYVRDLWTHASVAPFTGTFTKNVATHAAEIYKMNTAPINPPTEVLSKMDRWIAWMEKQGQTAFPKRLTPSVLAGMDRKAAIFDLNGRIIPGGILSATSARMVLLYRPENNAIKMVRPE